jgi:hypothetical protein
MVITAWPGRPGLSIVTSSSSKAPRRKIMVACTVAVTAGLAGMMTLELPSMKSDTSMGPTGSCPVKRIIQPYA